MSMRFTWWLIRQNLGLWFHWVKGIRSNKSNIRLLYLTSCPVAKSTNLGHLTPLSPSTGGGSSRNTQYTFPTNHTRHSTYLHYVLRVSNVSSPTNEFLYVSKLVRVASAFDIRRRSDGGGDPPKKNWKTTFSACPGAAPGSEKMWTI